MRSVVTMHEEEEVLRNDGNSEVIAFNVEHNAIMNAINLCSKVAPSSGAIPILQCIKFEVSGDTLFVTAMDTEQSLLQIVLIDNYGGNDGSFLFPVKEGIDLVKKLPHGNLKFKKRDSKVYISYGERGSASLKVLSPEEYPSLPELDLSEVMTIPIDVLRKGAFAKTFSSTAEDSPALSGIFIHNNGGNLGFVSTDRHRIYRYITNVPIENQETFYDCIVPAIKFKTIVDALRSEQVDMIITRNYLVLRERDTVYFCRLIDAGYPDLSNIFKGMDKGISVRLSRGELDDTLNRAISLEASNKRVTFEVDEAKGVLVLHAESDNSEILEELTVANIDGGFPTVKFNGKFLREALLIGDREIKHVNLRVSGSQLPGFMTMEGDPSITFVINPCV